MQTEIVCRLKTLWQTNAVSHSRSLKEDVRRDPLRRMIQFAAEDCSAIPACRAANRYVLVVVYYARGHCTTLMIISQRSPPKKLKLFIFDLVHACGLKCASNRLCVCLFHLCGVGCVTARRCSRFKPADQS